LRELTYIEKAEISALTHGGTIIFKGKENINSIVEKIDDIGYDVDVIDIIQYDKSTFESKERTITLKIDGIHCS